MDFQILSCPMLALALLVFGFAPGLLLRLIVLAFPKDDARRAELRGELYNVPRFERPFWVAEQMEIALFEGLRDRIVRRGNRGNRVGGAMALAADVSTLANAGGGLVVLRRVAGGCPVGSGEKCSRCGCVNNFDEDGWPIEGR
jgi:hypothetical protein